VLNEENISITKNNEIKLLVEKLNNYRNAYYNNNESLVSDEEYDTLFDELEQLEKETGIIFSNSPTITVGYEVKSDLKKVKHSHPMLSLNKTKNPSDLTKFANGKECLLSLKLDGLTILLVYENGKLIKAETRGNGIVGEDVTHNAKVFENIPLTIPIKEHYEIEGEAIITNKDFMKMNYELYEEKYKHPRNLASGSVRQLNSNVAKQRHLKFIAWKVPNGTNYLESLIDAKNMGFEIVPLLTYSPDSRDDVENLEKGFISRLQYRAAKLSYPIDGLVMTYNDMEYGKSLGVTDRYPNHSIAFKFYDEKYETRLIDVEWSMGKTDVLTPVAIFEPIEIDGTTVERASIHNLSIFNELQLKKGDTVSVYKANAIIPQIDKNITAEEFSDRNNDYISWGGCVPPSKCPICGGKTQVRDSGNTLNLVCTNPNCSGKLLGKLNHFVNREAMNIDGLSEKTIEKFIDLGYLNTYSDIYKLDKYKSDIENLEGFGKKSTNKLFDSIEKSKETTLDKFVYSLSIPLIGRRASKTISEYVDGDYNKFLSVIKSNYNWSNLNDFGEIINQSIKDYIRNNIDLIEELASYLTFTNVNNESNKSDKLNGKTFVITGSLNNFTNRDELKEKIESLGGKVSGSVSKKTDYLINNDIESTSGKNKKAKELNIPIINEETFLELIK